jgi:hypothetical protein
MNPSSLSALDKAQSASAFYEYLKRHIRRDSPLGDLARDVMRDFRFPIYAPVEQLPGYLQYQTCACPEAVATLKRAIRQFRRDQLQSESVA